MSEQLQATREVEVQKLKIRLELAEARRKAAGWLVHSADAMLSDTRSLVARSISADDTMDAALAVLDAAKQSKRAAGILSRAEQDIGMVKGQLLAAERVAAQYRAPAPPPAPPADEPCCWTPEDELPEIGPPEVPQAPADGSSGETEF